MQETPETLTRLQALMDRSVRTAGPAMKDSFGSREWRMSAEELVAFWGSERMASIATTSSAGTVHAAALDIRLVNGVFHVPTFGNALRLADHRANPRCVITSWNDSFHVAVVYGNASFTEGAGMVDVQVTPTRIYAIRAPSWHHAARTLSL